MTNCEIIEKEIAELEARQIDYSTAEKLAWLYIVRDHIKGPKTNYTAEVPEIVEYKREIPKKEMTVISNSEFMQAIDGKDLDCVMAVIDETMSMLQTTLPRLYNSALMKIHEI